LTGTALGAATIETSVFHCVRCAKVALGIRREGWVCASCGAGYPVIGEVPWLFRDPQDALIGWRARHALHSDHLTQQASEINAELTAATGAPRSAKVARRLEHSRDAYQDQVQRLDRLLAPLGRIAGGVRREALEALGTILPTEQGLTNYYVNVHRDWCWGDDENAAAFSELRAVSGATAALGKTLVLGAGAGRLAYDLAQSGVSESLVVTDFNPLLVFVGRDMFAGRSIELWEFPIAPRQPDDVAVLRALRAPAPVTTPTTWVVADALDAPFAPGAFDTVITPWFIDIVGEPLATLASRINAWLTPSGRWLNSGSLAFNLPQHAERRNLHECLEVAEEAGFEIEQAREASIPYMRSPASRHARLETIASWSARKHRPVAAPPVRQQPEWLADARKPVPRTQALELEQVTSRIHAFLLALVNGERSVADMAQMVAEQRLLPPDDAEAAVRQFLRRSFERAAQRRSF
jgi:hypothetical protein